MYHIKDKKIDDEYKISLISLFNYQNDVMQSGCFTTAIVRRDIIERQLPDGNFQSFLCVSDYGEYVEPIFDKYGININIYCLCFTEFGRQMCIKSLKRYTDKPEDFVIFYTGEDINICMKFNCIVGNPPYGMRTNYTHLMIMNTVLKFCTDKLVFIMPSKSITQQLDKDGKWYNMFKNAVCNKIEVVDKEVFKGTVMDNTAIYYCDRKDNPENYCKKLDVDKAIYYAIDDERHRLFLEKMNKLRHLVLYSHVHGGTDKEIQTAKKSIKNEGYYLNVNRASTKPGQGEIRWLSGILEGIDILTKDEEIKLINGKLYNIIFCPNIEYGENLKKLLKCSVLKYSLWLTQYDRFILDEQFKYVPDLDYTNIHTDEELLAACGFIPEEIEKMMDYLRHFDFSKNRNYVVRDYTGCEVETDEDE